MRVVYLRALSMDKECRSMIMEIFSREYLGKIRDMAQAHANS